MKYKLTFVLRGRTIKDAFWSSHEYSVILVFEGNLWCPVKAYSAEDNAIYDIDMAEETKVEYEEYKEHL
jgi:hypothetical protein